MGNKHKHYDMIVAKAANMDLVVFENDQHGKDEWYAIGEGKLPVNERYTYFLCLPQHKEACLYWLNGGKAEENYKSEWSNIEHHEWHDQSVFNFDDGYTIRIKPKKEKRWIGVHPLGRTTPLGKTKKFVSDIVLHQMIDVVMPFSEWQFIEIEVEV